MKQHTPEVLRRNNRFRLAFCIAGMMALLAALFLEVSVRHIFIVLGWFIIIVGLFIFSVRMRKIRNAVIENDGAICTECGYPLGGLTNTACPECGAEYKLGETILKWRAEFGDWEYDR